ncbi:MAG: ABC transporter permease subunit [Planctomycetes bacterium]|nr:ABC transporter permease subunit [Planctomycetota bacterium]
MAVFGSIISKDLISLGRDRGLALRRFTLALIFLVSIIIVWLSVDEESQARESFKFSIEIYEILRIVFLSIVCLIVPIQVATLLSSEKQNRTIELLLLTPLKRNRILIEKYISGCWRIAGLLLLFFPPVVYVAYLARVDPLVVLIDLAIIASTGIAVGGVAMFFATLAKRSDAAVGWTIFTIAVLAGNFGMMAGIVSEFGRGPTRASARELGTQLIIVTNPLFALDWLPNYSGMTYYVLCSLTIGGQLLTALAMVFVSSRLIEVTVRDRLSPEASKSAEKILSSAKVRKQRKLKKMKVMQKLWKLLDSNPVTWREIRWFGAWKTRIFSVLIFIGIFSAEMVNIGDLLYRFYWIKGSNRFRHPLIFNDGTQAGILLSMLCMLWFALMIRSCAMFSKERELHSFKLLGLTPLHPYEVFWGKYKAVFRFERASIVIVAFQFILMSFSLQISAERAAALATTIFVWTNFYVLASAFFSILLKKTGRTIALMLCVAIALNVLPMMFYNLYRHEITSEWSFMFAPSHLIHVLLIIIQKFNTDILNSEGLTISCAGGIAFAAAFCAMFIGFFLRLYRGFVRVSQD